MKILLIAGHGAGDSGALAFGRKEAEMTRKLVPKIACACLHSGFDVDIYDMSHSAYHDIIAQGYDYPFKRYDYVLEVHFNAYRVDFGNGKTTGCEIYVTPQEKVTTAEEAIVRNISRLGFANRGVKREKLAVIMRAKAQGVSGALLEVCFLDDADDMLLFADKEDAIASAIADGILEGYQLDKKKMQDAPSSWAEKAWKAGVTAGITDGLRPKDTATREELVTMLYRAGVIPK